MRDSPTEIRRTILEKRLKLKLKQVEAVETESDLTVDAAHRVSLSERAERLWAEISELETEIKSLQLTPPPPPPAPEPFADPGAIKSLVAPSGAIRFDSRFYVKREGIDDRLLGQIGQPFGTTTYIRGPRQVGKTSLLISAIRHAANLNRPIVYIDLQAVDSSQMGTLDTFLHHLCARILEELRLDQSWVDRVWNSANGPSQNASTLLEDYVLPAMQSPAILAMDEADKLLDTSYQDDFFGLLRSWHNERALNGLWDKLTMILVISTEPHLLVKESYQSPFNVGVAVEMSDFDEAQVTYLDNEYKAGVYPDHLAECMALFGGHPYLTQQAFYHMVTDPLSWGKLIEISASDRGPFGEHLRRYLSLLVNNKPLAKAMKAILANHSCSDTASLRHLQRAGLLKADSYQCRCGLYEMYLKAHL